MTDLDNSAKLRILFDFVKPYPQRILATMVMVILTALLEGASMGILYRVLQNSLNVTSMDRSALMAYFDRILGLIPVSDPLIAACILLIVTVLLKNLISYIQQVFASFSGFRVWRDNQIAVFHRYLNADYQVFLDHKMGELLFRIVNAPGYIGVVLNLIAQSLAELCKLVVIGWVLMTLAFEVSVSIAVFFLFYYFFTRYIGKNISYNLGRERSEAGEQQTVVISEMISGIRQIKLFDAQSRWAKSFFAAMDKYFRVARKDSVWVPVNKHLLDAVFISGLALVLIWLQLSNPEGLKTMMPVIALVAYAFLRIMPSLAAISSNWLNLMSVLPYLEMIDQGLSEKVAATPDGGIQLKGFHKGIQFDRVSFSYPGRSVVLKDLTMEFPKGKVTALVGSSGAGKTTIVDLITRLFRPTVGSILIDGEDLGHLEISSWLSRIGYVSQDTFIFNATIAENIAMGRAEAMMDEVEKAARDANAHEFIMEFPEGYNTEVGDRGMKISGGQRQRLAIARALLRKPDILILDEATSALDSVSEAQVQEAIDSISKDRTVIIIAHRLSTVGNADNIMVLGSGRVVEQGTHEQLLGQKGVYWSLYDIQQHG
ncbi:MAG: ABC transporter ATP-binding protein [Solirubrobacterales bacterium]